MPKVCEIRDYFADAVPFELKMDFDNVGFLAGFSQRAVSRVLIALDITEEVIAEAREINAELIISHHPLFFSARSVTDGELTGKKLCALIGAGLSAICLHTNLDSVWGGVNDALLAALGADFKAVLADEGCDKHGRVCGMGRIGELKQAVSFEDFLKMTKSALNANGLRYWNAGREVRRIAVLGGSGGEYVSAAADSGCDTFVTADIKYDRFLEAKALGINLIDGDHFCTENVVVPVIAELIGKGFPELDVRVSRVHSQTAQFYV